MRKSTQSVSIYRAHVFQDDNQIITANEYELNWRTIVFIPFGDFWQFVVNTTIVLNSFLVIYFMAYKSTEADESAEKFHYCMELIFLLDTLLLIMHR